MKRYSASKYPHIYMKDSGVLYLFKTINGVRVKKSLQTKKIREALELAERIENDLRKEYEENDFARGRKNRRRITNPSVTSLWEKFMTDRSVRIKATTKARYEYQWKNNLEPFWGTKHLKDFNSNTVNDWENWFIKHRNDIHYFNPRKAIVALYNYLRTKNYISEVLKFEKLDKTVLHSHLKSRKKLTYTRKEIQKIYSYDVMPYGLIFKLAVTTGARASELRTLTCEQVIEVDGVLHLNIFSSKNYNYRLVMVQSDLVECVEEQLALAKSKHKTYLFFTERKTDAPVGRSTLTNHFHRVLDSMGIGRGVKVFHDIRRTFATMTAEQGWPEMVACDILDMSSKIYQKVYVKISAEAKAKLIQRFSIQHFKKESVEIELGDEDDE